MSGNCPQEIDEMLADWILAFGVAGIIFWPALIDWICTKLEPKKLVGVRSPARPGLPASGGDEVDAPPAVQQLQQ